MQLSFTKMNGAGNDFVLLDNRDGALSLAGQDVARLCDRHRGVGADGVLVVEQARNGADFRMRYYNADGGEAEMCGNGARCFARFAKRLLADSRTAISFETLAGVIHSHCLGEAVQITMTNPHSERPPEWLDFNGHGAEVHFLNTGVPHAVVFVEDLEAVDVPGDGAALRHHAAFAPAGTNANFAQVLAPDTLAVRTYERGVEGETLACGTGICASALVHHLRSQTPSPISVRARGGDLLEVGFERTGGVFRSVTLTGPADFVFDGRITL